jgi:hypothetical protein
MTRVRFTKYGASTAVGEFGPGTTARVSDALAAHFVKELGVAEYLQPVRVAEPAPVVEPAAAPGKGKGKRK